MLGGQIAAVEIVGTNQRHPKPVDPPVTEDHRDIRTDKILIVLIRQCLTVHDRRDHQQTVHAGVEHPSQAGALLIKIVVRITDDHVDVAVLRRVLNAA